MFDIEKVMHMMHNIKCIILCLILLLFCRKKEGKILFGKFLKVKTANVGQIDP